MTLIANSWSRHSPARAKARGHGGCFPKDLLDAGIGDGYHGFEISIAGWKGDLSTSRSVVLTQVRSSDAHPFRCSGPRPRNRCLSALDRLRRFTSMTRRSSGGRSTASYPISPVAIEVCTDTGLRTTGLADVYRRMSSAWATAMAATDSTSSCPG